MGDFRNMKSAANELSRTFTVLLTVTTFGIAFAQAQPPQSIQQVWLDDRVVVSVPVATNRITTINFPGAITAIDGSGITVDGKTPGLFQLAHTKGSAFTFRARPVPQGVCQSQHPLE